MELEVWRLVHCTDQTLGLLSINGNPQCFTLEDQFQPVKVPDETRIPAGRYKLAIRTESGMALKYRQLYGDWHRGMLWLQNVPGFEWIYIHVGNTDGDTSGCILVGEKASIHGTIERSAAAYRALCERVYQAIDDGETVHVSIMDHLQERLFP